MGNDFTFSDWHPVSEICMITINLHLLDHRSFIHQTFRTLIVCVIRVYFLVKRVSIDSEEGRFAYSIRAVMLSVIESNTAIICGTYPRFADCGSELRVIVLSEFTHAGIRSICQLVLGAREKGKGWRRSL